MKKISCVLFDLGGVLLNWNNLWWIQEISKKFHFEQKEFSKEFYKNFPNITSGKIDEKIFWYTIGKELKSSKLMNLKEPLLAKIFRKRVSINEAIFSLSKNLSKKNISVGLLSNTESVIFSVIEDLFSLNHFKYKFLSYNIGHLKPNSMIYDYVINNTPFPKEELFFIDDLKSNVESARSMGIDSVQYFDYETLVNECNHRNLFD